MCGIAGVLGLPPDLAEATAPRMRSALGHRGPDAEGLEVIPGPPGSHPLVLAHTRLSILDPSPAAHQPLSDQRDPASWIVFNGEIYNFQDLGEELDRAGLQRRTRSDTEVILGAYRQWGPQAALRLRGMFAFCIADPEAVRFRRADPLEQSLRSRARIRIVARDDLREALARRLLVRAENAAQNRRDRIDVHRPFS